MIEVIRFLPEHVEALERQNADMKFSKFFTREHYQALEGSPWSFTGIVSGRIVGCAGAIPYWEGRGEAWVILDRSVRHEFLSFHNAVKRGLEICPLRRIEAVVDENFRKGHQWITLLGFRKEAEVLTGYWPDGSNATLYSKIKIDST